MKSVNKWIGLGNLGKDPEIKVTPGGTTVANLSIACGERRKDASGNWVDHTEWINLVAFGKTAEVIRDYVRKGNRIHVMGRIQTQSWEDRQSGEKKYRTQVVVDDLVLLEKSEGNSSRTNSQPTSRRQQTQSQPEYEEIPDDEIPF